MYPRRSRHARHAKETKGVLLSERRNHRQREAKGFGSGMFPDAARQNFLTEDGSWLEADQGRVGQVLWDCYAVLNYENLVFVVQQILLSISLLV